MIKRNLIDKALLVVMIMMLLRPNYAAEEVEAIYRGCSSYPQVGLTSFYSTVIDTEAFSRSW